MPKPTVILIPIEHMASTTADWDYFAPTDEEYWDIHTTSQEESCIACGNHIPEDDQAYIKTDNEWMHTNCATVLSLHELIEAWRKINEPDGSL